MGWSCRPKMRAYVGLGMRCGPVSAQNEGLEDEDVVGGWMQVACQLLCRPVSGERGGEPLRSDGDHCKGWHRYSKKGGGEKGPRSSTTAHPPKNEIFPRLIPDDNDLWLRFVEAAF